MNYTKINPETVPQVILSNESKIPVVGLGTFGSDNYSAKEIADAVEYAISIGYRHIDCASVYQNEKEIGYALKRVFEKGEVKREDLWITSKVWNDMHGEGEVIVSCNQSLKDLQLDYLDLYLVHWPFPNYHAPGCDGDARNPDSKPYIHEDYMVVWRQMEQLVEMGFVRNIGTSNMTIPKMKLLLEDAKIKPVVNEMELHPHFQQPELFNYMVKNKVTPIGYSPIGSPKRPERDKTPEDTVDIEDPVIVSAAERLKVHPAVICIKWAAQCGQIPIPFSVKPEKIFSNLQAVVKDPLTEKEMAAINKIDKQCRLIKGQVFLWPGADSWEDLWDIHGTITK
ncbi:MAG: aldo/keto reductase [Bacteroidales bacterium]|nr:aldo/keto reductase [Bacteroidales bacterium]MBN2820436.1 aldo/keto reductase [Bacteroidales bacterium]